LEAIHEIHGIERIRFTTSHPKDLSPELIRSFGRLAKLCEHIHLPLQSGSNRVLKRMNRGYVREEYLEKINQLRKVCPQINITSDIIVGFPGEEEADFQSTLDVVEQVQFDDLFSFRYSDRPYTRAAEFQDKVPEEVSRRRLMELQARQRTITLKRNKTWEGRQVEVLVEGRSKENADEKSGRTRTNHTVNFSGTNAPVGSLVQLRVVKAFPHSLRGERIV
jgi:tRNA-2-methylthio-N6-dimethylallyladenosine synthase